MRTEKKILVVDDDEAITDVFRKILEAHGFAVNCCASSRSALKMAEKECYHAVVADYYLPESNGAELALTLRALCPDLVIIGMSAGYTGEDFARVKGAFFLRKPVTSGQLLSLLNQ